MNQTDDSRARGGEFRALLRRNPAFARAYSAQLVSFGGDWFATVALQGLVLELTHKPSIAALLLTTQILPTALASPFAGVVADHFDRRAVMIAADVLRALLAFGLLFVHSTGTLWIAFVCMGTMSLLAAFFDPASSAALPNLVNEEDLPAANVLMGSAWGTMLAVGAAIGGAVAATLGRDAAFVGDALSFLVSAALLGSIKMRFQSRDSRPEGRPRVLSGVTEMLRFARTERHVGSLLIVKAGFGLAGGVLALIAVMATEVFDSGDRGIGLLMSARGAGALVGPFLFRRLFGMHGRRLFRSIAVAFSVFGAGYVLFGLAPTLWVAAAGAFLAHLGGGAQWTLSTLGLQRYSPDAIRGRVFAADYALISLTIGASMVAAGFLAGRYGTRPVVLGLASLGVVWTAAWTALTRGSWPDDPTRNPSK